MADEENPVFSNGSVFNVSNVLKKQPANPVAPVAKGGGKLPFGLTPGILVGGLVVIAFLLVAGYLVSNRSPSPVYTGPTQMQTLEPVMSPVKLANGTVVLKECERTCYQSANLTNSQAENCSAQIIC